MSRGNVLSCVGVKACRPTARSGRGHSARFANFANLANLFGREFLRCAGIFSVNAHCPCVRLYLCAPRGVACETFFIALIFCGIASREKSAGALRSALRSIFRPAMRSAARPDCALQIPTAGNRLRSGFSTRASFSRRKKLQNVFSKKIVRLPRPGQGVRPCVRAADLFTRRI